MASVWQSCCCRWSPHLHVLKAVHIVAYRPHTPGREQQPRDTYVRAQRTPYTPYQIDNEHCTSVAAGVQSHDVLNWYSPRGSTRSGQRHSLCTTSYRDRLLARTVCDKVVHGGCVHLLIPQQQFTPLRSHIDWRANDIVTPSHRTQFQECSFWGLFQHAP